ncbi:NADP-dependent oxidoreductase domain-containing protein [Mycena epipterygia]|nr:NADP-dependent oxidoreductase domain-containing protein [Mycena epipterygia]
MCKIGNSTFAVIGFGAMGLSAFYGSIESDEERFKIIDAAHAARCTFWDTADAYLDSEEFKRTRKWADIFLCAKFGFMPDLSIDGSPEHVRKAAEASLTRLGVESIDLYYLHRADYKVPIEAAHIRRHGRAGQVGASSRAADRLTPFEYSPFTLDIEDPKINLLARLLTACMQKSPDDFEDSDFRKHIARYTRGIGDTSAQYS